MAQAEARARLEAQAAALTERLTERLAAAEAAQRQAAVERDAALGALGPALCRRQFRLGAPTRSHPEDGSDSSDNHDDSKN